MAAVTASTEARDTLDSARRTPPTPIHILGISGSLRRDSLNRKLLKAAAELAAPTAELELWDDLKLLPPFDQDDEHAPGYAVLALREAIAQADAVLIATPQYNASLPGQLKTALDWPRGPTTLTLLAASP